MTFQSRRSRTSRTLSISYMAGAHADLLKSILDKRELDGEITEALVSAIEEFKRTVPY